MYLLMFVGYLVTRQTAMSLVYWTVKIFYFSRQLETLKFSQDEDEVGFARFLEAIPHL